LANPDPVGAVRGYEGCEGGVSGRSQFAAFGSSYTFTTCAQSLLAPLWISCSLIPAHHTNRTLQPSDRKTTSLTHGFYWFFFVDKASTGKPGFNNCPQSLLALLWTSCLLYAVALINKGLQHIDQKTTKALK
jgi:hypothetical protein